MAGSVNVMVSHFSISGMLIVTILAILPASRAIIPDDNYLIYSNRASHVKGGLYLFRGTIPEIIQNKYSKYTITFDVDNVDITGIDTDVKTKTMFIFESLTKCLYSFPFLDTTNLKVTTEHCGISTSSYVTIAFDWISRNIYWTDPYFGWIVVQPVGMNDKSMFRIIVQKDNNRPGALAVDPVNALLFWFDQFVDGERIERSLLTGENRTTIITTESGCVADIVADIPAKRIYWVDYCRNAIETANYDGSDRKVFIREDGVRYYDLAIEENNICTTIPDLNTLMCHDKISGVKQVERFSWSRTPRAIALYDRNKQKQRTDWCATNGCEHFCINKKYTAQCMCKEGYELKADGKFCSAKSNLGKGILASTATEICQLDFRVLTGKNNDMICFLRNVNVEYMSVNMEDNEIYFADKNTDTIKAYNIITNTSSVLYSSSTTSGMAFNWIDKDLYWTESGTIRVFSILTRNAQDLYTSSNMLYYINLDPHNKTLFWMERTSNAYLIKSSSLDASGITTLSTEYSKINGLFYDGKSNRLYYSDASSIRSFNRDGTGTKLEYSTRDMFSTFAIYKSYAFWAHTTSGLESFLLTRRQKYTVDITGLGEVMGLSVFDTALQPKEKGHCAEFNGGCEHICIGTGVTRECRCRFGFQLNKDGTSCDTDVALDNFILGTDKNHGKIYQISLKNGRVTSLDLPSLNKLQTAVYDTKRKFVFWTQETGVLMRSNLDGSFPTSVYKSGYGTSPYKIAIDETSGYVYFTVTDFRFMYKGTVMVLDPVSNYQKTLIKHLDAVEGLALYPSKNYIFYVNYDFTRDRIYRASMDGKTSTRIKSSYSHIHSLTIDYTSDKLYWIQQSKIISSDLSGSGTTTLTTSVGHVTAIVASNGFLYYAGDKSQQVVKYDLKNKKLIQIMNDTAEMGIMNSLDIEDSTSPPAFTNPPTTSPPHQSTTTYKTTTTPSPSTTKPTTTTPTTTPLPTTTTTTTTPKATTTITTTTPKPTTTTTTPKPTTTTTTTPPKPTTTTTTTTPKPTTTTTTTTPKPTTTTTTTTPKPTTTTTTTTPKPTTTTTTTTPKPTTTTTTTTPKPTTTTTTTTPKPTTTTTTTTPKPTTTTTTTTPKPTTTTTTTPKPTTTTTTTTPIPTTTTKLTPKPRTTTTTSRTTTTEKVQTTGGAASVCSDEVVNGQIDVNCVRKSGHVCHFTCNDRYKSDIGYNIICTASGQWSEDVKSICRRTTAVVLPQKSESNSGGVYIGVGGAVGAIIIVAIIVIAVFIYRRRLQDKPRIVMRPSEEGFVNPSYTAEGVDNSTVGYSTIQNTMNHPHDHQDNHDYDTVSTTGGKREMRHSEYMVPPNDHIYESIKPQSTTRSGRRPGGVAVLNGLYYPDADYATTIAPNYYQPTMAAGNPFYGAPHDIRAPSGNYEYMYDDDPYRSTEDIPSRRGSRSKLVKDKRR